MKLVFKFFVLFVSIFQGVHGILAPEGFSNKEYVTAATSMDIFNQVCYIRHKSGFLTGVVIHPRLVITAAHGVVGALKTKKKSTTPQTVDGIEIGLNNPMSASWKFWNHKKVSKVLIHPNYSLKKGSSSYDVAILVLADPIETLKNIEFPKSLTLKKDIPGWVGTYGSFDLMFVDLAPKRAFCLPEWDLALGFSSQNEEDFFSTYRLVPLSSVFFSPAGVEDNANLEKKERTLEALKNWNSLNRPPVGMALPGTSGSPVFIKDSEKDILLGLVTSFSALANDKFFDPTGEDEAKILLQKPRIEFYGRYQTIVTPFYMLDQRSLDKEYWTFVLSPDISAMMNVCKKEISIN